jgi:hypothetical protein
MKPVPKELLAHLTEIAPPGSEVIPMDWAYEDEDYNIAVFIDDQEDARLIEVRLLDVISDYDEAHGTFTVCVVWHKREKALAGMR